MRTVILQFVEDEERGSVRCAVDLGDHTVATDGENWLADKFRDMIGSWVQRQPVSGLGFGHTPEEARSRMETDFDIQDAGG